ncbi:MAG: RDD family protein [Bacteroidetes bacterium]|nr:RDD family protein [Bacteroidota bacterium]
MSNGVSISKALKDQLLYALNYSRSLKADSMGSIMPTAIVLQENKPVIKAFPLGTAEQAAKMFEQLMKSDAPEIAVYLYESTIYVDKSTSDVILFKAYDSNDSSMYTLCQKFRQNTATKKFELVGDPAIVDTASNPYFTGESNALLDLETEFSYEKPDVVKKNLSGIIDAFIVILLTSSSGLYLPDNIIYIFRDFKYIGLLTLFIYFLYRCCMLFAVNGTLGMKMFRLQLLNEHFQPLNAKQKVLASVFILADGADYYRHTGAV